MTSAREAALRALIDIDENNAYAGQARDTVLRSVDLYERSCFCTQLIFGVTKFRKTIDHIIETFQQGLWEKRILLQETLSDLAYIKYTI